MVQLTSRDVRICEVGWMSWYAGAKSLMEGMGCPVFRGFYGTPPFYLWCSFPRVAIFH